MCPVRESQIFCIFFEYIKPPTLGNQLRIVIAADKGCQIFIDTIHQNGEKLTKLPLNQQNGHKIYQLSVIFSISRLSKNYQNWNFWFENIPSGNPAVPTWRWASFFESAHSTQFWRFRAFENEASALGNPRDNDCKGTFLLLIFENYPLWF
jgi:hypothetical protein